MGSKVGFKVKLALGVVLLCASVFLLATLLSCGEEECLVSGENCSTTYKEENYGTTDIYCCSGLSCVEGFSGYYVCR